MKGNNSDVVKRALEARPWWVELPANSPAFNFVWQPFLHGVKFEFLGEAGIRQVFMK